jgi:hypothetical protein
MENPMSVSFSYSSPGKDRRHPQPVALLVYQAVTALFPERFPYDAPIRGQVDSGGLRGRQLQPGQPLALAQ